MEGIEKTLAGLKDLAVSWKRHDVFPREMELVSAERRTD
jgi:hypothetical protein